jgi:hypothetical protein
MSKLAIIYFLLLSVYTLVNLILGDIDCVELFVGTFTVGCKVSWNKPLSSAFHCHVDLIFQIALRIE